MSQERKLASIRKISKITPIEGADNIEKASIDGWNCVVKKGEFKEGDLCVYFEIDSFLPIRREFEFLRKSSFKKMAGKEGFRLKTIRLKGIVSQGLALSLSLCGISLNDFSFGDDVTDILDVVKFEPPMPAELVGMAKGLFPSFIRKTNQERVQNIWNAIKDTQESFEVTVKLDGTSCTYYLNNGEFGVCSRNLELKESDTNTLWKIARKNNIEESLRRYGNNIALQGEVIGEGIQGNPEGIHGQDFYLFDIWDINQQEYIRSTRRHYLAKLFELKHIPIIYERVHIAKYHPHNFDEFKGLESILSEADGPSINDSKREGLVYKSNDSGLTFKVISNFYLLNEKN